MKNFKERPRINDRRKFNDTPYSPERRAGDDRKAVNMERFKRKVV